MNPRIGWLDLEPEDALPRVSWESFKTERGLDGPPSPAAVSLFMAAAALEAARSHASSSPQAEIGGILYGRTFELTDPLFERSPAAPRILVDIVAALAAHSADGTPAHLTFTPAAWDHVFARRQDLAADLEIVGWYHSHPGLGIFLSDTDRRTHAAFFKKPWQVAIVLDPCSGQEGTFAGPEGTRVALGLYRPVAPSAPVPITPPQAASRLAVRLALGACVAFAGGLLGRAIVHLLWRRSVARNQTGNGKGMSP